MDTLSSVSLSTEIEYIYLDLESTIDNLQLLSDGLRYAADDQTPANAITSLVTMQRTISERLKKLVKKDCT